MQFRLLGPLEVWDGDVQIEIGGTKRRAVLAVLLLHANEVCGSDQLVDELWGEQAPANAVASLHNHVSRLRKALGPDLLATRAWGYVLRVEPEQIDAERFARGVVEAEPLPARERSAKLAEALGLWRGAALADLVFEPAIAKEAARLEESRLVALEARIDADLELGRQAELIGELEALVGKHPLRERFRGQLILALYRAGRQAEALEVYRETRRLLSAELGLEPGPALRELERAILRQDPALAAVAARGTPDVEQPIGRRRTLAFVLLAVAGALAVTGIAAFAALRGGDGAQVAQTTTARTQTLVETVVTKPPPRKQHRGLPVHHSRSHVPTTGHVPRRRPVAPRKVAGASHAETTTGVAPKPRHRSAQARTATNGRATSKPETRAKPEPRPVRISDDFLSGAADPNTWQVATSGSGVGITQGNGRVEMTMSADAAPDTDAGAIAASYVTACTFPKDFDATVSYALDDWPSANGSDVGLQLDDTRDAQNLYITRNSLSTGEEIYAGPSSLPNLWQSLNTNDVRGALRIKRVGTRVRLYYAERGQWVSFDEVDPWPGPVRLRLTFWTNGSSFGHQPVTVAFDDFSVDASAPSCP